VRWHQLAIGHHFFWPGPNNHQFVLVRFAIGPGALVNPYTVDAKDLFEGMTCIGQLKSNRGGVLERLHRSWV
jgi:hypothetical protein